jgi:hypothetical protein
VQIKGQGSGFVDQETGKESEEPMHIHITCVPSPGVLSCFDSLPSGPEEGQVARAKALTDDLLEVVRGEYAKVKTMLHQQQMELHQAQMQYASYGMMGVRIINIGCSSVCFILCFCSDPSFFQGYAPPPPSAAPPPPPPGDQPPPPPSDGATAGSTPAPGSAAVAPAPTDMDAYAAYWCVSYLSRTRVTLDR